MFAICWIPITIRLPSEFLKLVRHSLLFQAASIFANQRS